MSFPVMQIEVLLFAAARDAAGQPSIQIEVGEQANAAEVLTQLGDRLPAIKELIPSCRLAVDNAYVDARSPVRSDQEIALIPPVSGG